MTSWHRTAFSVSLTATSICLSASFASLTTISASPDIVFTTLGKHFEQWWIRSTTSHEPSLAPCSRSLTVGDPGV